MATRKDTTRELVSLFLKLPLAARAAVVGIVVVAFIAALLFGAFSPSAPKTDPPKETNRGKRTDAPPPSASPEGWLFCFWNVENLFDDRDDPRPRADERYDTEFSEHPELLRAKLANLSKVLLAMNGGRGPDILAVAEVESLQAAELLRDRLNDDLPDDAAPYLAVQFVEQKQGRHIAPAVFSRLPVLTSRTDQVGAKHHRNIEVHLEVEGKQLVVIASHWKSRIKTPGAKKSDEEGRIEYAEKLFGRFREMWTADRAVDLLICGDFNDDPDDVSVVKHLHAGADRERIASADEALLFNLAAGRDRDRFGTLYHSRWHQFDQIVVSPGLLDDRGWTCVPDSFAAERGVMSNRRGRPWRFDEDDRGKRTNEVGNKGFADHFPVTVRLKVRP